MTLPPKHMVLNFSPGGLRLSTLPLGYGGADNMKSLPVRGKKLLWNLNVKAGDEPAISDFPGRLLYPLHQGPAIIFTLKAFLYLLD